MHVLGVDQTPRQNTAADGPFASYVSLNTPHAIFGDLDRQALDYDFWTDELHG